MCLIQGASEAGAILSRAPQCVGMLHVAPPSEQRVTCSYIVAGSASLVKHPMRCALVEL